VPFTLVHNGKYRIELEDAEQN